MRFIPPDNHDNDCHDNDDNDYHDNYDNDDNDFHDDDDDDNANQDDDDNDDDDLVSVLQSFQPCETLTQTSLATPAGGLVLFDCGKIDLNIIEYSGVLVARNAILMI